ncbi:MAG: cysteine desulfurase family protein [Actinomycetota bacterium]|nr:cysteine desulfurase family protein [Actinomycetota bacterium]
MPIAAARIAADLEHMLYLDHAATTPIRPEVGEAMAPYLGDRFGNPSGIHGTARGAKNSIEEARERIAASIGAASPLEIVFTSGGTEADNLALIGAAIRGAGGVVATAVEHPAVLESVRFLSRLGNEVTIVSVDSAGRVSPDAIANVIGDDTSVVSVMTANNETGVIQPVTEVARLVRSVNERTLVHTDAVQSFGSLPVDVSENGSDLISVSGHKIGGPQGAGFLYVRDGIHLEPVIYGGGQELGRRSGTHNVTGIVGLSIAVESAVADRSDYRERVGAARDRFEHDLRSRVTVEITAGDANRLVSHAHVWFPGIPAETLLVRLDFAGVAAAAGAACHSGAIQESHVLAAMGIDNKKASESVRFSFGRDDDAGTGTEAARIVSRVVEDLS